MTPARGETLRERAGQVQVQVVEALDEVDTGSALHPRRRIVVLLREDGRFTFAEQYHFTSEHDGDVVSEGWQLQRPEGVYADLSDARADAKAATDRLRRRSG